MSTSASALDALSRRVEQLLAQFAAVRTDNQRLRATLCEVQAERDELRARIETAAQRLEAIKNQLPAD